MCTNSLSNHEKCGHEKNYCGKQKIIFLVFDLCALKFSLQISKTNTLKSGRIAYYIDDELNTRALHIKYIVVIKDVAV